MDISPLTAMDSRRRLVFEARNLRDHLLHEDSAKVTERLTCALWPFGKDEGLVEHDAKAFNTLQSAFLAALSSARDHTDSHTIREVLSGRSPYREKTPLGSSIVVVILAVAMVVLVIAFSVWSTTTQHVLAEFERFLDFDHETEVTEIIEFATASGLDLEDGTALAMLPRNNINDLRRHYHLERTLPSDVHYQFLAANPAKGLREKFLRAICSRPEPSGLGNLVGCPPPVVQTAAAAGKLSDVAPTVLFVSRDATPGASSAAEQCAAGGTGGISTSEELLRCAIMTYAGRPATGTQYIVQHENLRSWQTDLRASLDFVSSWTFPVLYGALGSLVFSAWRILSPGHSPLPVLYIILRTVFAGLAAMILAMLLIPSNYLVISSQPHWPLVYLIAFIFGYSIEPFIHTLNHVNATITRLTRPKDPEAK